MEQFHAKARGSRVGRLIRCERQRFVSETVSEWSHEHMHRQHLRPLCAHRPHFLQHFLLWGKEQNVGRGKTYTHLKETEPAQA